MNKWYLIITITPTIFLGWASIEINFKRKTTKKIPKVSYNFATSYLHYIIKTPAKCNSEKTFSLIPASEENHDNLSIDKQSTRIKAEKSKTQKKSEFQRFV